MSHISQDVLQAQPPSPTSEASSATDKKTKNKNRIGLTIVSKPRSKRRKPIVDIIFIHGLSGRSHSTWSYKRKTIHFWPPWLRSEAILRDVRISTFGYDSSIRPAFSKNFSCIHDFAEQLLVKAMLAPEEDIGNVPFGEIPIILITHSMGGLVAEEACNEGIENCHHSKLVQSICAVIFLGTPHKGSKVADVVDNVMRTVGLGYFVKNYMKELRTDSAVLKDIDRKFRENMPNISIVSLYETRGLLFTNMMLVQKTSAVLGYTGELKMSMDADHHTICKFRDREDEKYITILLIIQWLVGGVTRKQSATEQQLSIITSCFGKMRSSDEDSDVSSLSWIAGSCEWIVSHNTFLSWSADRERKLKVFWVYGPPGGGKSVLSAFIKRHLKDAAGRPLCYSHITAVQRAPASLTLLFKSFAYQLLQQLPTFRHALAQSAQEIGSFNDSSWYSFWTVVVECLRRTEAGSPIYWIIDGIYRCRDPKSFITALEELSAINIPLRILIVNEESPQRWIANESLHISDISVLNLSSESSMQNDLRLAVTKQVEDLHGIDDLQQTIVENILTSANGNFLCATLLFERVKNCRRRDTLLQVMSSFPQGIMSHYQIMDMELRSGRTKDDEKDTRDIMPWILYVFDPLTLRQISEGMDYVGVDLRYIISRICGRFVVVDEESRVRVINQSAADYMSTEQSVLYMDSATAHHGILVRCLDALKLYGDISRSQPCDAESFVGYATRFWHLHLEKADDTNSEMSTLDLTVNFFRGSGILNLIFLILSRGESQYLIEAALAVNRFARHHRRNGSNSEDISFLEKCSIELYRITEMFSPILLQNPRAIFEIVPLFCPPQSFIRRLAKPSIISIEDVPSHSWDTHSTTFKIHRDCRGSKIVAEEGIYAISTSTQEGLVLIYKNKRTIPFQKLVHGERVTSICFNHHKTILATYGYKTTRLWNIASAKVIATFANESLTKVLALTFTPDDKFVLVFGNDHVLLRGLADGSSQGFESTRLDIDNDRTPWENPTCASFNAQCNLLAIGFPGDSIEIWDVSSLKCTSRLANEARQPANFQQLYWSPLSNRIVALQNDSLVLWDVHRSEVISTSTDITTLMSCSRTGQFLVTGNQKGSVKVRRMSDLAVVHEIEGPRHPTALSITSSSGRVYGIWANNCTIWEPTLLAMMATSSEDPDELPPPAPLSDIPSLTTEQSPVTALASCPTSSTYCAGCRNGEVVISIYSNEKREKVPLNISSKVRIEHVQWSPDGKYLAIADLAYRVYLLSFNPSTHQYQTLFSFRLESYIEQLLFNQSSKTLLAITESHIVTWILDTSVRTETPHSLGRHSRWTNHPTQKDLFIGFGCENVEIRQWDTLRVLAQMSLDKSLIQLAFSLDMLEYVKNEPAPITISPSLAVFKIKRILTYPSLSIILLVTSHETMESISAVQFLLLSVDDLDKGIGDSKYTLRPVPLIESLSDAIAMPLAFLPATTGPQESVTHSARLVFVNKQNAICSVLVDESNMEHLVQRHILLPSEWLSDDSADLIQLGAEKEVLAPRLENVRVVHNALRVCY